MPLSAPAQLTLAFAQNGVKNTIPNPSQIAITPGLASYNDGFPPLTRTAVAAGGVPPFGEDMNGVLYALSLALQWEQAGGSYAYSSTFATAVGGYPLAATVPSSDGQGNWLNTTANNTADPENAAAPNGWQPVLQRGITSVALTNANVTLTNLQSAKENIVFTGTLTGNVVVTVSPFIKDFKFINGTTGAFTVSVKTPAGGAIVLGAGATTLRGDGTTLNGPDAVNVGVATLAGQAAQLSQTGFQNQAVYINNAGTQQVSINGAAFTATGAITFAAPVSGRARVKVWGAGGGSGATWGAGSAALGGGGGAYAEANFIGLSTPVTVTVGLGGTAGVSSSTPTNGGTGGTSSFGSLISCTGGQGGIAANGGAAGGATNGGTPTTVNNSGLLVPGAQSSSPFILTGTTVVISAGGQSFGTPNQHIGAINSSSIGQVGFFPGGGANGSAAQANGTAGANGCVILEW